MVSGRPKWWTYAGSRWISKPHPCTSAEPRTARLPRILSADGKCASSAATNAKVRNRPSCWSPNAAPRYRRPVSPAWSSGQPWRPIWASRRTPTCCATRAGISSPTMATTRERSKRIWGIAIFRIRRAIPRWRRSDSRNFFEIDQGECIWRWRETRAAVSRRLSQL
jgi:hypothetical protein